MGELKGVKPYDGEFDEEDEKGIPGPEDDDSIPVRLPKKRRRRSLQDVGPTFWTAQRVFITFVFLLGLVIGSVLTHQYVEPELNKQVAHDLNSLSVVNAALDKRVDSLVQCLHSEKISPDTCLKEP